MNIIKFNHLEPSRLKAASKLKPFILSIFKQELKQLKSLEVIFCNNAYILYLNNQSLQHDYYTDILTYDLSTSKKIISEMYISVEMVDDNSIKYNTNYQKELHRVIFHGVLHLCGYKDKSNKDISLMRTKEDYYLEKYFA
jgi:probable rRNA maturation factor